MSASSIPGTILIGTALLLGGCHKKAPDAPPSTASAPSPSPEKPLAATTAETAAKAGETAARQSKLDYSTMEDAFLNDANGQWAVSAKASSSTGEDRGSEPETPEKSRAWQATGRPDGNAWSQLSQDIGFDWIELGYAKPVHATEVRVVMLSRQAAEAITRVEWTDSNGVAHTVWSGLSDQQPDDRGSRTWFVRKFARTAEAIKSVKLTFANNVASGFKDIDAVQIVGD